MLEPRARVLLKALVERYITDGEPVGSRTLSRASGLDLSPASIRNIMADLEEMGFIISPHTSAGRIPTPRGYRFFVDTLMTVQPLDSMVEGAHLQEQRLSLDPARAISGAATMLSELTHFAGLVMSPKRSTVFSQIEFLKLAERRILLVMVSPQGEVQNRVLTTDCEYSASQLADAGAFLNQFCAGQDFESAKFRLAGELRALRSDIAQLATTAMAVGEEVMQAKHEGYVISGERNLLDVNEITNNVANMRKLFGMLEEKTRILELLDMSSHAEGIQIFIGGDSKHLPLDEMSMVIAPYEVGGRIVGTLGVIGPTRMAYERVVPIVDVTAKLLSSALSQASQHSSN